MEPLPDGRLEQAIFITEKMKELKTEIDFLMAYFGTQIDDDVERKRAIDLGLVALTTVDKLARPAAYPVQCFAHLSATNFILDKGVKCINELIEKEVN